MRKYLSVFETGLFWLVTFLFVFIPLYPKFPLLSVRGTFVAIRLEDLLIALAFILGIVYLVISKQVLSFAKDKLNQSLVLFFFIGAVSLFSAIFLTHTVQVNLGVMHYLRRIEYISLLPLAYIAIKSKKQILTILSLLFGVTFIVDIYALGQKWLHWPVVSTGNSEFSKGQILYLTPDARVNSTFAGHYDLAVYLAMILVVLTVFFFYWKDIRVKALTLLLMPMSFLVLIMTAARLSFVAAIIGIAVSLLLIGKRVLILLLIVIALIAIAYPSQLRDRMISTITINLQEKGARYTPTEGVQKQRSEFNVPNLPIPVSITSTTSAEGSQSAKQYSNVTPGEPTNQTQLVVYRSLGIRLDQEWPRAVRALEKNPFLGTGYSSLGLATDNDLLRSLGEVGILGTFAFGLVLLEISKRIWKIYKSGDKLLKHLSVGVLIAGLVFVINASFIDVFEASKIASIFWMLLGINLAGEKLKGDH